MIEPRCHIGGIKLVVDGIAQIPGANLELIDRVGDILDHGPNVGQPNKFGTCALVPPNGISVENRIVWLADFVESNRSNLIENGATEFNFEILWFGRQGNIELSVVELKKLSQLNMDLCIDYIQQDDE